MNKSRYTFSLLAAAASMSLVSCQSDDLGGDGNGREVTMNVALRFNPDDTRTQLTEVDGDLRSTWEADDKVWVFDESGNKLGELGIVDGAGEEYAHFNGTLTGLGTGEQQLEFVYFGRKVNPVEIEDASGRYVFSFATQDGSFASLSDQDFLWSYQMVTCDGASAYTEEMGLRREIAFGHFELQFPDGVNRTNEPVTISGDGLKNTFKLKKTPGSVIGADSQISVTGNTGNDLYVTIVPGGGEMTPTFTVTIDGMEYTGSLAARKWTASEFVRKSHGVGVPVVMTTDSEPEDPNNPGNIDNWGNNGSDDGNASVTLLPQSAWEFSKTGRYTNCLDLRGYGGWSTCFEYTNAVTHNLLSSNGTTGFYFQWGRLMGFPSNVKSSPYLVGYSSTPYQFGTAGNPGGYMAHYEYQATQFSTADSNKYPYVFVGVTMTNTLDWSSSNTVGTWESFSGNPCPDGYRLPTPEEMSIFVPSDGEVNGSKVEYKTIDGVRYAIEWTVVSGSTPYFQVRTAKTNATNVKAGDAIFENSSAVKFVCYGYLMNNGVQSGKGTSGIYWTNANGSAGDLLDASGNGGQALYFEINGTTATILIAGVPRTFGGCVMPIKDETAVGTKYRPWFPWGAAWPN